MTPVGVDDASPDPPPCFPVITAERNQIPECSSPTFVGPHQMTSCVKWPGQECGVAWGNTDGIPRISHQLLALKGPNIVGGGGRREEPARIRTGKGEASDSSGWACPENTRRVIELKDRTVNRLNPIQGQYQGVSAWRPGIRPLNHPVISPNSDVCSPALALNAEEGNWRVEM
jgi:hypothetical protein